MYQRQSHQTSSLKILYIMTTHQAHHHGNQMSVLVLWESDVSLGAIFKNLLVNMTSTSHPEDEDEDEEMIQSDTDP